MKDRNCIPRIAICFIWRVNGVEITTLSAEFVFVLSMKLQDFETSIPFCESCFDYSMKFFAEDDRMVLNDVGFEGVVKNRR